MTSTTPKYVTNLTTGDQGAIHKLKPRSFNKLFSALTSLSHCQSLLSIIAKYIPPWHCTLLWDGVWFLTITLYLLPSEFYPWQLQNLGTCISLQFPLQLSITCILLYHLSSLTSTSVHRSKENDIHKRKKILSNFSSDRVYDQRATTASFFHTFHFIIFFLSSHSFLLILSV